jgi:hypothetical protein
MTYDEVLAVLRPYMPAGAFSSGLGGHGGLAFRLADGQIFLHFASEGGRTIFYGPSDPEPPMPPLFVSPLRLIHGGDFPEK